MLLNYVNSQLLPYTSLEDMIQWLEANYTNSSELPSLRMTISNTAFNSNAICAVQASNLLQRILIYNRRYIGDNPVRDQYSPLTIMKLIGDAISYINATLAGEVLQLWNLNDSHFIFNLSNIKQAIGNLEEKHDFIERGIKRKVMIATDATISKDSQPTNNAQDNSTHQDSISH